MTAKTIKPELRAKLDIREILNAGLPKPNQINYQTILDTTTKVSEDMLRNNNLAHQTAAQGRRAIYKYKTGTITGRRSKVCL